ncbi:MAG: rnhA operon protein [Halobellus sp.]|uniref:DUF7108 family protein n=1 Tax=Halobellus sp. TaxID=1979212 RepID=UPI0035D3E7F7
MADDSERTIEGDSDARPAESSVGRHPDRGDNAETAADPEIPEDAIEEAERLTRLAREAAVTEAAEAYRERRADVVDEHDFTARVREEDDTLVLYPGEWIEDGVVQFEDIEDTDRAVEVSLSGPDHGAEWETVEERNREVIEAVREAHGQVHAANVRAFADFMGNHYLKPVTEATLDEREEFLTEYFPRNAWPTREQESIVTESVNLVVDGLDDEVPGT